MSRQVGCRRFFFQAEDGIRDLTVTGVQTCALPIYHSQCQLMIIPLRLLLRLSGKKFLLVKQYPKHRFSLSHVDVKSGCDFRGGDRPLLSDWSKLSTLRQCSQPLTSLT